MKRIKKRILSYIIRKTYNAVSADDVVRIVKGQVVIGNQPLTTQKGMHYVRAAKLMQDNIVWQQVPKIMSLTAQEKLVKHGDKQEDQWVTKGYLLCLNQIQQVLIDLQKCENTYKKLEQQEKDLQGSK